MTYDELLIEYDGIAKIEEIPLLYNLKGLYYKGKIIIDSNIDTNTEKCCILSEELGHHFTTSGNIIDIRELNSVKQEIIARNWAYEKLCPLSSIVQAYKEGVAGRYELAEYLDVTEEFLFEVVEHYKAKYGTCYEVDKYLVYFEPCLAVLKMF
ncbi:hypothetical protein [Clostridium sp.]|uniref:ImmA/IrrE family metallo-endopeptidase n=1 Tax=Clostridium sp. TaxID=1506 RepID=UPI003217405A